MRRSSALPRFFVLLAALIGAFWLWKKGYRFFRHLAQTSMILTGAYVLLLITSVSLSSDYAASVFSRLGGELTGNAPNLSLHLIWNLVLISDLVAVVMELFEQEAEQRTELAVLTARNELAMESYENLCRQSQEVMMIRHDTMKHYSLLRQMAKDTPERIEGYLNELIGQVDHVRPVISTENQTLNILLNGKLHAAAEEGISTEIVRADAPRISEPFIRLDLHCKDRFFVFSCENSRSTSDNETKKIPTQTHGYGIKIIRQIMSRFGDHTLSIEESETTYQVTVILPL